MSNGLVPDGTCRVKVKCRYCCEEYEEITHVFGTPVCYGCATAISNMIAGAIAVITLCSTCEYPDFAFYTEDAREVRRKEQIKKGGAK